MSDTDDATTIGQMLYYARRAGYLEGALRLIAEGRTGVRPRVAAKRALEAVGTDRLVNSTPDKCVTSEKPRRKLRNN